MTHLMITHFNHHWDNVPRTKYPKRFIDSEVLKNMTAGETVFVKIDQNTQKIERVWEGRIDRIELEGNDVSLDVVIERERVDFTSLNFEIKKSYWRSLEVPVVESNFGYH